MPDRWPDLSVLELLVTVAELGSLGAASEKLGITQPSASRSLARFERRLGITLLERSTRGSRVTPEGAIYVDWSREVLDAAERLVAATGALRREHASHLRVAASMTVAEYLVPRWLADFRRSHPGVDAELTVTNSDHVGEALREGTADEGFIETSRVPHGPHWTPIGRDRLVVVVAPGHPWTRRRRPLTAQELAATALVVREEGSGTRRTLHDACADAGLALAAPAQELASNAAVRISAMAGTAPAVLSELAVREQVESGSLVAVRVDGIDLGRILRAGWMGGSSPIGQASDLIAIATRQDRR